MGNDLFGGLVKGLSSVLPQDDPNIKKFTSMTQVNDLKAKEKDIYAEVGKKVMAGDGASQFPDEAEKLKVVQKEIAEAEGAAKQATAEAQQAEAAAKAETAERTCPSCGMVNEPGVKFCQECGTKIGGKTVCPQCGVELPPGTRFCGECGAKIGE